MTPNELLQKLEAFDTALAAYGVSKFTGKELWDLRATIMEDFRSVPFTDPGQRKDLWQRFQDGTDMLRQKGALLQLENEAFATEAEEKIEALQRRIDALPPGEEWTKEQLAELRAGGNELFDFLRQNRWPSRERRTQIWDRFTACRDRIKALEDGYYARVRDGIRERQERSAAITRPFREALEACRPASDAAALPERILALLQVFSERKLPAEGMSFVQEKEALKTPLKLKSDTLRELRRLFTEQRSQFSREDATETYALLSAIQKEMDAAWTAYKGERQRRTEEWVEKQKAFRTMLQEKVQKRLADKEHLEKVLLAKKDFLPRLEKRLESQRDYLNKLFDDLDELKQKRDAAHNFDFRQRMEGLIEGKLLRIQEVEQDMTGVQERVATTGKDIEEIDRKIGKMAEGIAEMQAKVEEVQRKMDKGL